MQTLPKLALSVRQPWAWGIFNGKPVENRDWKYPNPAIEFRGRCALHAAKGLTRYEYEEAATFMAKLGVTCPPAIDLKRGGIIGSVEVVDFVKYHPSPWFMGPRALVLRDPQPCEFIRVDGNLGFFKWEPSEDGAYVEPARWMMPSAAPAEKQGELL